MLGDRACGLGGAGHGGLGVVWPVGDGASWVAPFRAVSRVKSWARARPSSSEVYPVGKLQ